jgi:hypothetical protein
LSLGKVGRTAEKKGFEDAIGKVVKSLINIGVAASSVGAIELEDVTRQAARSLAKLTILSEEIAETAIHDYKSKLKEQDHDAFKKFMEICKQELEKLRAEK